ncbi:MAG: diguanylate cyclase [Actinobacteria bacterium]|nr:diguanylate cyclase [Actinomycetota bacterium]
MRPDAEAARDAWTSAVHAEELLRTVIDESPDIILMKDWDGKFLLGNRALARLYGTTPEDLVGVDDGAFNPNEEQVAFYLENVRGVMRSGETEIVMEESTDVETGETHYYQSIKRPLIGPDGEPRILVIAHDLTDLQRANRVIQDRERSYSYAMAAAGDGIWDWDIVSDVVTHNAKWMEMFGITSGQLQHPIGVFTEILHPDDREDVQRAIRDALTGSGTYQHEHRMVRGDGTMVHVFDRGQVVERDDEGNPTRMAGAVHDITERILHEHRLRVITEALIDANVSLESKVEERTNELARANSELQNLAWRDALTGLPNRLAGMNHLDAEFARLNRNETGTSSILMMDVDLFKKINDTYGHGVGDDVLTHIASTITESLRAGDFVARFGGEEFMALLPDTDLDGAVIVAEKIREAVEGSAIDAVGTVTLSIGVTVASSADAEMDIAVRRADTALYDAKRLGRNLVVTRSTDSD